MSPLPSITVVSTMRAPFIRDDVEALSAFARVRWLCGSGMPQVLRLVAGLWSADLVVCWFASVYAGLAVWMARRLRIPSIVMVGGVDVAKMDEIGYGLWTSPLRGRCAGYALRNASRVLVVDASLVPEVKLRAGYDGGNTGVLATGYDANYWRPLGPKQSFILTVAGVHDLPRMKIKGIDHLLEAALQLPEYPFVIVGVEKDILRNRNVPSNVTLIPPLEQGELLPYYQRARVYCQSSIREGLSNALCEAMLCECIPIATDVGGSRHAVGDTGILVAEGSVPALARGISEAMQLSEFRGRQARARITSLFPRERRTRELHRLVKDFVG